MVVSIFELLIRIRLTFEVDEKRGKLTQFKEKILPSYPWYVLVPSFIITLFKVCKRPLLAKLRSRRVGMCCSRSITTVCALLRPSVGPQLSVVLTACNNTTQSVADRPPLTVEKKRASIVVGWAIGRDDRLLSYILTAKIKIK